MPCDIDQIPQHRIPRLHPPRAGADEGDVAEEVGGEGAGVDRAADAGQGMAQWDACLLYTSRCV